MHQNWEALSYNVINELQFICNFPRGRLLSTKNAPYLLI